MQKIIGYKRNDFAGKDGTPITGYSLYLATPAYGNDADGQIVERQYMSDNRLNACGYKPQVGDNVEITFNRFGKVAGILKLDA